MSTRVALSSNKTGKIVGHAGKCKRFLIYDIEQDGQYTKSEIELTEEQQLHNLLHSESSEIGDNPILNTNILLTQSIGQGAINNLAAKFNIAAYIIKEDDPDEAIEKLVQGRLQAYAQAEHDHHHHHHHDHDHDHGEGGCGCGSGCGCH